MLSDMQDLDLINIRFPECKVWRNPMALFRGAEYNRVKTVMDLDPLTYYDMNLSAQDHQSFFTCDEDVGRPDYDSMQIFYLLDRVVRLLSTAKSY